MRIRTAAAWAVCAVASLVVGHAQENRARPVTSGPRDAFLGVVTYRLWDGDAPGARGQADSDVPTLTLFRVHTGTGNGAAVIIAPGGAYLGLASNLEGRQVADWFAAHGVTAFVLKYRLGKNYLFPTPLVDAQRAVRFVRSRAREFGVAPDRIGIMGFSAGGHLAASVATSFDAGNAEATDVVERASSRPDFVVLGYPWLNAMKPNQKVLNYCGVMNASPEQCAKFEQYSPDQRVTATTPPAFIYHTTDDELVPVDASVTFYRAMASAGVPVEMHLFAKGRHGSGLGLGDGALDLWPIALEGWLRGRGMLTADPAVVAETQRMLAPPKARPAGGAFAVDQSVRELTGDPGARAVLVKHLGADYVAQLAAEGRAISLQAMALLDPEHVSVAVLGDIDRDLRALAR